MSMASTGTKDPKGDMYEYLLSKIATSGTNGQFRTPRHIIQMMTALADPKLGESICDPACGTGGFLIAAYEHILSAHTSDENCTTDRNGFRRGTIGDKLTDERQWEVLKDHTIFGYDFDATMIRIGAMNLMLHGLDNPNIDRKDTLSKNYSEASRYDVVLANPPDIEEYSGVPEGSRLIYQWLDKQEKKGVESKADRVDDRTVDEILADLRRKNN